MISLPIRAAPYEHQRRAAAFALDRLAHGGGAALLMEMGTGKTLCGIAVMGVLSMIQRIQRALIVCPLSIIGVWEEEMTKFADYPCSVIPLRGNMQKKKALLDSLPASGLRVVVCNYESMWRLEEELEDFAPQLIIADEGHRLKDGLSRQSKAMHRLGDQARYRLLLTGTAITNRELDIWSEYRFAAPEVYGTSFYTFRSRFFYMAGYGGHEPFFRKDRAEEFMERLHSVAFRVRKEECLDLPAITEEIRAVELEPKARRLYESIEHGFRARLEDGDVTVFNVLTQILRLSQITGGHLTDDARDCHGVSTAKLDALYDIIDSMAEEGRKLVVMARFVAELDEIEALLRRKKIGYAAVRGGVKDRAGAVRRFQEDPDCTVFVGQIQAAGMGLTLTAASTMVFYSLDYNMASFDQAKARIHRVSQTKNCHYIYLCCRNTVDFKVLRALRSKIDLAKAIIDDYRDGNTATF